MGSDWGRGGEACVVVTARPSLTHSLTVLGRARGEGDVDRGLVRTEFDGARGEKLGEFVRLGLHEERVGVLGEGFGRKHGGKFGQHAK